MTRDVTISRQVVSTIILNFDSYNTGLPTRHMGYDVFPRTVASQGYNCYDTTRSPSHEWCPVNVPNILSTNLLNNLTGKSVIVTLYIITYVIKLHIHS